MSTPSLLLSCAGAAASLAGVWTLAGLSERAPLLLSPRVLAVTGVGVLGEVVAYFAAPSPLRSDLALPLLFATAGILAMGVGSAKIDAALTRKDGACVVRRASGIVAGGFFAMAAVGAASLDLGQSSLHHARLAWALMFSLVASVLVVFVQRTRYAGAGLLELGHRAWLLAMIVVALLVGAGLTRSSSARAEGPAVAGPPLPVASVVVMPPPAAPAPAPSAPAVVASAAPVAPSQLSIEAVSARGMLEADARSGVARRMDRLTACLADPKNTQTGTLNVKASIDAAGSVADSRALGGDLASTPVGACLLRVFYNMGFASPSSGSAAFEITLRVGAP